MRQSKEMSLLESMTNVIIGYGVTVATQVLAFPLFGLTVSLAGNLAIGGLFTVTSIIRSYAVRRLFKAIQMRGQRFRFL